MIHPLTSTLDEHPLFRVKLSLPMPRKTIAGAEVQLHSFLTQPWMAMSSQHHAPEPVRVVRTGEKSLAPAEIRTRIAQPVASHYTD